MRKVTYSEYVRKTEEKDGMLIKNYLNNLLRYLTSVESS